MCFIYDYIWYSNEIIWFIVDSDKFANHWLYKIKGSLCACGKWFVHWLLQPYTIYLI